MRLQREKLPLIRFEKGEKEVVLEVPAKHSKKVFAILRAMCYNIKRESTGGKALPLYYLSRRIGAVLGAAVFFWGCMWARPVVLAVEYRGGAAYRKAEFSQTLQEAGVFVGARATSQTLSEAKKALYAAYPNLYFVSVEKRGFHVTVTAQGAIPTPPPIFLKALTAPTEGVVLRVNVLRGTATVSVGDVVSSGQQLANGSFLSGETLIQGYVVGEVVLLSKHTESVLLPEKREELPAMLLNCSMHQRGIENATEVHLTIEKEAEGYRHTASYTYVTVVRGG
ncbi:MAG: sporulation protein YqfD [Clostridia bacterium]|nr:sporulation protein YqfD [Clostridia bacterium]